MLSRIKTDIFQQKYVNVGPYAAMTCRSADSQAAARAGRGRLCY